MHKVFDTSIDIKYAMLRIFFSCVAQQKKICRLPVVISIANEMTAIIFVAGWFVKQCGYNGKYKKKIIIKDMASQTWKTLPTLRTENRLFLCGIFSIRSFRASNNCFSSNFRNPFHSFWSGYNNDGCIRTMKVKLIAVWNKHLHTHTRALIDMFDITRLCVRPDREANKAHYNFLFLLLFFVLLLLLILYSNHMTLFNYKWECKVYLSGQHVFMAAVKVVYLRQSVFHFFK